MAAWRIINLVGIILLLGWISFLPQTIHNRYLTFITTFLLVLFLFSTIRQKIKLRLIFDRSDIPLWIFLIGMLAGVFSAENFGPAVRQYFNLCLPLFLLYYLMKLEFIPENRWPIIKSICFFSALVALFGIIEFRYHINPIYDYWEPNNQYYKFFLGQRAMSTKMHPAVLGTYLLICLPFSFSLANKKSFSEKLLGILSTFLLMLGIVLTFSRGVLFGVIAIFCLWFWQKKKILYFRYFIVVLFLLIFVCSLSKDYSPFQRFGIKRLLNKPVFHGRMLRVIISYRIIREHPFFGIGLTHFRRDYNKYSPESRPDEDGKVPDNMFLLFLTETGIVGLLSFIIFIGCLLKKGFRRLYTLKDAVSRDILIAAIAGMVGLLVNMNTYDILYWTTPLFLFSMLAGMITAIGIYNG